uniref:hypothetical protein n=1 Tax=Mycobacterium sp. HUMS_1102779 TaxID=3383487 RepID=UPI00389A8308
MHGVRAVHALWGLTAGTLLAACATNALAAPPPHGSQTEKWIDLKVGQCLADLPPADLSRVTVTVVDCGAAHLAEVYLRAPMAVDSAVAAVANRDCKAGLAPYTGRSAGADPTPSTVICLLQGPDGRPLTGSAHR